LQHLGTTALQKAEWDGAKHYRRWTRALTRVILRMVLAVTNAAGVMRA
jgi:hypothetical protein